MRTLSIVWRRVSMTDDEKRIADILIDLNLLKEDIIGLSVTIRTLGLQKKMLAWLEENNECLQSQSVVDAQSAIVRKILSFDEG